MSFALAALFHAAVRVSAPLTLRDHINTGAPPYTTTVAAASSSSGIVLAWPEMSGNRIHLLIAPLLSPYSTIDMSRAIDVAQLRYSLDLSLSSGGGLYALRDRDLKLIGEPIQLAPDFALAENFAPVWNGREFVLTGAPYLYFLSTSGLRRSLVPVSANLRTVAASGAATDRTTLFATKSYPPCADDFFCFAATPLMQSFALDASGSTRAVNTLIDAGAVELGVAVAASDSAFIATWVDNQRVVRWIGFFDADGNLRKTAILQTFDHTSDAKPALVASDGNEWILVSGTQLLHIDTEGIITDMTTVPAQLSPQLVRLGAGSYALVYVDTVNETEARIQLVRIETQSKRTRGARH